MHIPSSSRNPDPSNASGVTAETPSALNPNAQMQRIAQLEANPDASHGDRLQDSVMTEEQQAQSLLVRGQSSTRPIPIRRGGIRTATNSISGTPSSEPRRVSIDETRNTVILFDRDRSALPQRTPELTDEQKLDGYAKLVNRLEQDCEVFRSYSEYEKGKDCERQIDMIGQLLQGNIDFEDPALPPLPEITSRSPSPGR